MVLDFVFVFVRTFCLKCFFVSEIRSRSSVMMLSEWYRWVDVFIGGINCIFLMYNFLVC